MKPLLLRTASCVLFCSFFFIGKSYGQCPNSQPYSQSIHDSLVSGEGYDEYGLPQFDPSLGTLYSVLVQATVNFTYHYTLTNTSSSTRSYTIGLNRGDDLEAYSPENSDMFTVFTKDTITVPSSISHTLPAGQSASGSVTIYNNRVFTTTFDQNVVPFLGTDTLLLRYLTATNANPSGGATASLVGSVDENINFHVVYNYCPSAALPSTFIKLSAINQNSDILLAWTSQQILSGGSFELLKSIDGRTYISVNKQTVNSNSLAGYNYLYKPTAKDPSKAFFRIKQTDQDGNVTYSKVITVILPTNNNSGSVEEGTEKNLVVYPTIPTGNFINVFIPSGTNTDEWTISIISLAGRVMQQSKFSKTNLARVDFTNPLAPGMYIVDAYNTRTQEHFKDKIVVQH